MGAKDPPAVMVALAVEKADTVDEPIKPDTFSGGMVLTHVPAANGVTMAVTVQVELGGMMPDAQFKVAPPV